MTNLEQFRMQRPAVELKDQFCDLRSNGKHDAGSLCLSNDPRAGHGSRIAVAKCFTIGEYHSSFIISISRSVHKGRF